jgi:hypothetical protein
VAEATIAAIACRVAAVTSSVRRMVAAIITVPSRVQRQNCSM